MSAKQVLSFYGLSLRVAAFALTVAIVCLAAGYWSRSDARFARATPDVEAPPQVEIAALGVSAPQSSPVTVLQTQSPVITEFFARTPRHTFPQAKKVIARIWHGRTLTSKADEYYDYLKEAGINKIEAIEGNLGAQVLRRPDGKATEFVVISYWESLDAIKKFAGEDVDKTHFLPKDSEYLLEMEPKVRHFEVAYDGRK